MLPQYWSLVTMRGPSTYALALSSILTNQDSALCLSLSTFILLVAHVFVMLRPIVHVNGLCSTLLLALTVARVFVQLECIVYGDALSDTLYAFTGDHACLGHAQAY